MGRLMERDAELDALASAAATARAGSGSLVLVEGPAGAGKSALLAAAPAEGMQVLRAAGGEWERDYAFGAIRQLLARVPLIALTGAAALAAAIVASPPPGALEPGFALFDAIYWAIAGLAGRGPVLIAVDDLHWVDDASLQGLGYLARRVADLPVLVVGTLRPAEPGAGVERLDGLRALATVLAPAPLSPAAVAALVRADRPEADDAFCARVHAGSAGNPLYVRELLLAGGEAEGGIPTLGERVVRRVARVAPEAPALAGAIAVVGDGAPLALATELAELDSATAERIAHELVRIEVLAADDPPVFAHPVIRHSLYAALSSARRASMHATAAERLEAGGADLDAIARHLGALPADGSAAVATRLLAAGRDALDRGAVDAAMGRLRRALEEEAGPRAEILFELGRAEAFGQDPACFGHLEEALALAGPELRPRIRVVLSERYAYAGRWRELATVVDGAAGESDPGHELAAVAAAMDANDSVRVDRFEAAWDDLTRLSRRGGPGASAIAALLASEAVSRGRAGEVDGHVAAAWASGRFPGGGGLGTWPLAQLLMALVYSDQLDQAEAMGRTLIEAGRRLGATSLLLHGLLVPAWLADRRGDLVEAESHTGALLEIVEETGLAMWITSVGWMLVEAMAERLALEAVATRLTALELPPEFDITRSGANLRGARAQFAFARGDRATAAAELREAEPVLRALRVGPAQGSWRSWLAVAAGEAALAEEDLALARATGYPRPIGIALRALGTVREDPGMLRESLAVLDQAPSELERARTRVELGAVLRRQGDLVAARAELAAGADLAHRCGAERLFARAREEQQGAGARPRRPASTGHEALTARERHIAGLAAAGRTNAEIAQELYVSVKTVETHLTNTYGKLGLTGRGARGQLDGALRRRGTS